MNKDILKRGDALTDEKYDWLEKQEELFKKQNDFFDIERQTDVWYTLKIAELQLLQEKIIDTLISK